MYSGVGMACRGAVSSAQLIATASAIAPTPRDHRRCLDAIGGEQGGGVSGDGYLARFSPGRAPHPLGLKSRRGDRPRPEPLFAGTVVVVRGRRRRSDRRWIRSARRPKCKLETTLGGESLGSCVDEERSQLR